MPADASTQTKPSRQRTRIGWREYIAFPEWGVSRIRAKTDTGAKSSAIDVAEIIPVGSDRVRFRVITHGRQRRLSAEIECAVTRITRVRSSDGASHPRLFVEALIRLGTLEKRVEIGLVERPHMLCRALIGRSTLGSHFLIDPSKKYLLDRAAKLPTP